MMNKKFLFSCVKKMAFLGIMGVLLFPCMGNASVFTNALNSLYVTFTEARIVVYTTAGFGLVGVAVAAISGKLPWKWFTMIAVALFTLASAEKIVQYTSGVGTNNTDQSDFSGDLIDGDFKIHTGTADNYNYEAFSTNKEDANFRNSLSSSD